jgi:hypothetical protein
MTPTKRQRAIAEEEFPLFSPQHSEPERITNAKKRIKELELLIHHWEKSNEQKELQERTK